MDGETRGATEDHEFGMKPRGKIIGRTFLMGVPFPRSDEGGEDTDSALVIPIAETPPPLLWKNDDPTPDAGALLAVRPSDGTSRCAIWLNMVKKKGNAVWPSCGGLHVSPYTR